MADDTELGVAYISLLPSMSGFPAAVERQVGSLGINLGRDFGRDFAQGAIKNAAPDLKRLEAAIEAAQGSRADAAGKARVAELRLAEARKKSGDESSRVVAAEQALAKANRELANAEKRVTGATEAHAEAQKEMAEAADDAEEKIGPLGRIVRKFRGQVDDASDSLKDSRKSLKDSFIGGLAGGAIAGGIGVAVESIGRLKDGAVDFFKESADAASDLNEAGTATEAIFGKRGADALAKFARNGAEIGQTATQVLDASATFGTFGKAAGLAGTDLSSFASDFVTLSSDLASFKNTSPEDAVEAIGAALRGESEPIRRYGVLLDDATLRQEAMRLGLIKTTKQALTPQQKVLAAQAAIMKQTKDAQGDFRKTSDGLANSQRILAAESESVKREFGELLLPLFLKGVTIIGQKVIPVFRGLIQGYKDGTGAGGAFRGAIEGIGGVIESAIPYLKDGYDTVRLFIGTLNGKGADGIDLSWAPQVEEAAGLVFVAFHDAKGAVTDLIDTGKDVAGWVQENKDALVGVGIAVGTLLIPPLLVAATTATVSGATMAGAWVVAQVAAARSSVVQFIASYRTVAGWVASSAAAVASGATTVAIWAMLKAEAIKGAAIMVAQQVRTAAAWVLTTGVMLAASAATKIVAAGQWLLNIALSANPIGLVVIAIAAFVAGLIIAYKKSETFRKIVDAVWKALKIGALAVFNWLRGAVVATINFVKNNWRRVLDIMLIPVKLAYLGIKTQIRLAQIVFEALVRFFKGPFRTGINALIQIFKHPVETAKKGISVILGKTGLQKVFTNAVAAIGRIWSGLEELAKKPIRFIVMTVLENGLLAAFRTVSGIVGFDKGKDLHVGLPKGFRSGTSSLGVLPGYTPGRDVHTFISPTGGRLDLSGGEAILRPEVTATLGSGWVDSANAAARAGGADAVRRLFNKGRQAFAKGGLFRPVGGRITQGLHGQGTGFPAIDFGVPVGTRVAAGAAGRVTTSRDLRGAGNGGYRSYGRYVVMDHGSFKTLYAHLSRRGVSVGQTLSAGQVLGLSGNTGNSTGPHLHFGAAGISPYSFVSGKRGASGSLGEASDGGGFFDAVGTLRSKFAKTIGKLSQAGSTPFAMMARSTATTLKDAMLDKAKDFVGAVVGKAVTGAASKGIPAFVKPMNPEYIAAHRDPQGGPAYDIGSSGRKNTTIGNALRLAHTVLGLRYVIRQMQIASARSGWKWRPYSPITGSGDFRHERHVHVSYGKGYANGTRNARPGLAWVGETEPELVDFKGGERVYNSKMIAEAVGQGGGDEVHAHFHGPVGATASDVVAEMNRTARKARARRRYAGVVATP